MDDRDRLRATAWEGVSLPELAEVRSARAAPGDGYVATVAVLADGRATDEVIEDAPIASGWSAEAGLFAPPAAGDVVLVQFVGGRRSEPVITARVDPLSAAQPARSVADGSAALMAPDGAAVDVAEDDVALRDAAGDAHVRVSEDRVAVASSRQTLLGVLERLVETLEQAQMTGTGNDGAPVVSTWLTGDAAGLRRSRSELGEVLR